VAITNAYPSYECTVVLWLSNTGSIPFNIVGADLTADVRALEVATGCFDLGDAEDPQIDPGLDREISCTIHVLQTAEQNDCSAESDTSSGDVVVFDVSCSPPGDATELVSYEFALEVCVAQWNEDPEEISETETAFESCKNSDQHEGPDDPTDDNTHPAP
jgi:hypothetical protein